MKKLLLILLFAVQSLFALVSIAPVEIGKNKGIHTEAELALSTKKGNTDKENYKAAAKVVYDQGDEYVAWAELSLEYGESANVKDTNNAYSHLRYIHITEIPNFDYEFFTQLQNDEFKRIINRTLFGGGGRYKLFSIFENDKGYVGFGAFYEHIDYSSIDSSENQGRFNTYFAYTITLDKTTNISYNLYYQPLMENIGDYINTHALELKTKIYKQLALKFKIDYEIDSKPASGVKKVDLSQITSLVYSF